LQKNSGKWGGVFCKKVDLSSTQGALCTVSVFFILHFTYLGGGTVRTKRTPPCLRAWMRQRAAGLPLAGDVDRLLHDAPCSGRRVPQHAARRSAANASSVTFTAAAGGWTQTWFKHVFHLQVRNTNYFVNK